MDVDLIHEVPKLRVRVQWVKHGVHELQAEATGQKAVISLKEISHYGVSHQDGVAGDAAVVKHRHANAEELH
jgi:hypothetical protein